MIYVSLTAETTSIKADT